MIPASTAAVAAEPQQRGHGGQRLKLRNQGLTVRCPPPTCCCLPFASHVQGNVGLAIFLTVASNVVGVIFVPLWLKVMLSTGSGGVANLNINIADM